MSDERTVRWQKWVVGIALCAVVAAVFFPSLQAEYVFWDDDHNIYRNPHVKGLTTENVQWMFGKIERARRYMPLGWLGWAVQHELFSLNPRSSHAGNLLFHCANAILLLLLLRRLLACEGVAEPKAKAGLLWISAIGALFWAVHPLRVEAVAWASGRLYTQAFFFALAALLLYLRYAQSAQPRRWLLVASVACYAASLLTYPVTLSFLVLPLLLDIFPLRRLQAQPSWWNAQNRRVLLEKLPFLVMGGFVFGVTLWARMRSTGAFDPPVSLEQFGVLSRAMQAFYIWAYYIWKPWWPFHLAPAYDTLIIFHPAEWRFIGSLLLVVGISRWLGLQRHRWPWVFAIWICYLLLMVPVLGLTEHPHYSSDRYSYGPAILWSLLLGLGLRKIWLRPSRPFWLATAVLLIGTFSILTYRQTQIWQGSERLFRYMLAELGEVPLSGPIHWRLGYVLAEQGRDADALSELFKAVRLNSNDFDARVTLAGVLAKQNRPAEAAAYYLEAVRLNPNSAEVLNDFAWLLATHPDENIRNGTNAVRLAERACGLSRGVEPLFIGTLAAAYAEAGRFPEAIAAAEKARSLAQTTGRSQVAETNQKLLELYRAGKAARTVQ
jgi:protein O-mannosyl-transferase